jgi:hypothetical protein
VAVQKLPNLKDSVTGILHILDNHPAGKEAKKVLLEREDGFFFLWMSVSIVLCHSLEK